jgi:tetratricopeptide (TPR) repeat protein
MRREVNVEIERARALHQKGHFESSAAVFKEILAAHPENAEARYRYGNLLKDQGLLDAALASYDRAIALKHDYAHALCYRAVVLGLLNRLPEALASYDGALAIDPTDVVAHCNRAALLNALGRKDAALAGFDAAVLQNPMSFAAHFGRGTLLQERRQWLASLQAYDRAVAIKPDDAPAHFNRGTVLKQLRHWEAALASYDTAVSLNSELAIAYAARGEIFEQLRRFELASESYDRALSLHPEDANLHNNRAVVRQKLGHLSEAISGYDRAIALKPQYAEAYYNRGTALEALGDLDAAVESYDRAIAAKPDYLEAHLNRGSTLQALGRVTEAIDGYQAAILIDPDFAEAHYNLALASLQLGDFATGWRAYEWRWRAKGGAIFRERRHFAQPLWTGQEPVSGKTVLLYGEQGLGDSLQFCRYVHDVSRQGAKVILELPAPLVGLCSAMPGVEQVIPYGHPLPDFEFQCPLMSLPMAFKTTLDTIPSPAGYLKSDVDLVAAWQRRLGEKNKPRIGLTWSGKQTGGTYGRRHFALAGLIPHLPRNCDYFCLQTEVTAADQDTLAQNAWIAQFPSEILDFENTAALCECMDLVITVDTSIAHLAGALGKKTWVLLAFSADWRWLTDREDSPWYHAARLFRQESRGDWIPVFERVQRALRTEFGS